MTMKASVRPAIAVFAYSEVGYVCLDELFKSGANVVAVFTHEDSPDENIWFRSVGELAKASGVQVRTDADLRKAGFAEVAGQLREMGVELIFSFYYRAMIPEEILAVPRLGAYNMHGALLPRYRGRACINWAVLNGETETGATLHVMTAQADRGGIIDREAVAIQYEDTAHNVFLKVADAARKIIGRSLHVLEAGEAIPKPQDEAQVTVFGRRRPEDGLIDWNKSAEEIYNMVRALTHPFPGAFTTVDGKKLHIWKARAIPGGDMPGRIVSRSPLMFGTGSGLLEVLSYQFEGEPEGELLKCAS